jgi:hypothetical protein
MAALASAVSPSDVSAQQRLSLPVACELGRECFLQHHFDTLASAGVRDHACGAASYDGHDGVDFRVLSAEAAKGRVSVIAAAEGRVLAVRDGEPDQFAKEHGGLSSVRGKECGNGLVIDHGGGLSTQYCHLLSGSVAVAKGQRVQRGTPLGAIGYSGLADFAHLHLTVRVKGQKVDPFTGRAARAGGGACRPSSGGAEGLWTAEAAKALAYRPAEILQTGLTSAPIVLRQLEHDHDGYEKPGPRSTTLLLFARIMNVDAGDVLTMTVTGPGDFKVESRSRIERHHQVYVGFAGKRRQAAPWAEGVYVGLIGLERGGKLIESRRVEHVLK